MPPLPCRPSLLDPAVARNDDEVVFETARPFLLALALGLLIGIERERAQADSPAHDPLGSRTFTLLALLGAVAAHVEQASIAVVLAVFSGAIILAGYFRTRLGPEGSGVGVTTEVAAMATFVLGYLARHEPVLSIMLAVIMIVVLALKPRIHQFAKAGLKQKEVSAGLTFLVIAFVVLPLLPDRYVDPWELFNPARLWLMFVLIAGMSFAGYAGVRVLGPKRGLALAGLVAGLVSSTAATLALAHRSRAGEGLTGAAATGIVLANVVSAATQIAIVAVIYADMLPAVVPVIGAPVLIGLLGTAAAALFIGRGPEAGALSIGNPVAFRSSAMLGGVLAVVLVATSAAERWFGTAGVLVTAALGGSFNVRAVTLAVSNLAGTDQLVVRAAVLAILIAFVANMAVKLVLAGWVGGRKLLLVVAPPLLGMVAAAILAFVFAPAV